MNLQTTVAQGVTTNFFAWGLNTIWHGARIVVPKTTTGTIITSVALGTLGLLAELVSITHRPDTNSHWYKVLIGAEICAAVALICEGGLNTTLFGWLTLLLETGATAGAKVLYRRLHPEFFDPYVVGPHAFQGRARIKPTSTNKLGPSTVR